MHKFVVSLFWWFGAFLRCRNRLGLEIVVLRQQLFVYTRKAIKAFELRRGGEFHQVVVARFVFGEEEQVIRAAIEFLIAVASRARGKVRFKTDDRFDTRLLARIMEFDRGEHRAVIGDGEGALVIFFRALRELSRMRQPVEETVFGMDVQVNKFRGHFGLQIADYP